jgi:hypothetical protein
MTCSLQLLPPTGVDQCTTGFLTHCPGDRKATSGGDSVDQELLQWELGTWAATSGVDGEGRLLPNLIVVKVGDISGSTSLSCPMTTQSQGLFRSAPIISHVKAGLRLYYQFMPSCSTSGQDYVFKILFKFCTAPEIRIEGCGQIRRNCGDKQAGAVWSLLL